MEGEAAEGIMNCGMDPNRERLANEQLRRERLPHHPAPHRPKVTPDDLMRAQHRADRERAQNAKRLDVECARLRAKSMLTRGSGARPKGLPTCAGCDALAAKIRAKDAMLKRRDETIARLKAQLHEASRLKFALTWKERARAKEHGKRIEAETEVRRMRSEVQRATWRAEKAEARLRDVAASLRGGAA